MHYPRPGTISFVVSAAALAAIIARGVAAYQNSLPAYARDEAPAATLPHHVRPRPELPDPEPIITLSEERQAEICLSCQLSDCVGIENEACPIRIAQRDEWRRKDRTTKGAN